MALKDWASTDADQDDADLSNNIRWTENQAPSTVNNSARAMMTQIKRWWDEIDGGTISNATVGGTADVITLTTDQTAAYAAGQRYMFIAGGTNTTNVTVNKDGEGAKALNSHGDPLAPGAIVSGDVVIIVADGTDFELVYPRRQIGVDFELVNDDAGASGGPVLSLYRNSATPAASDALGDIQFYGEDSAGNKEQYGTIVLRLIDPTTTEEDGELQFYTKIAGSLSQRLLIRNGIYTPNATDGNKGADTINASGVYDDGLLLRGTPVAAYREQQTSGTAGGTFSSTGAATRVLNTEVYDPYTLFSVSSNQITVPAGNWLIKWSAPAFKVRGHQSYLYDVTGTSEVSRGTSEIADDLTGSESEGIEIQTRSFGFARVTPSSSNVYEIRHECESTQTSNGLGKPASQGTEVYTIVEIYAA